MTTSSPPVIERMPSDQQRLAIEGFFGMMERWGVDNDHARRILGFPAERTFYEWKKGKAGAGAGGYAAPHRLCRRHLEGAADRLFQRRARRRLGQAAEHVFRRPDAAGANGGRRRHRSRRRAGLYRCRPRALVLHATRRSRWRQAWRIIASRYPPIICSSACPGTLPCGMRSSRWRARPIPGCATRSARSAWCRRSGASAGRTHPG